MNTFYHGDCKVVLAHDIAPESIDLIYLDPPFFTGKIQKGNDKWHPEAMEISFQDSKAYWAEHTQAMREKAPLWLTYLPREDDFKSYLYYMMERLELCHTCLKTTGSIYVHCDWRASHYLKMIMDNIFGVDNLRNEVIWHYISAPESKHTFGRKHDVILFYSKTKEITLNIDRMRIPHSPNTKAQRLYKHKDKTYTCNTNPLGKALDDVWDVPIIGALSTQRIGYPTQKPLALLERIILASSNEGDIVGDPFCGCGTAIIAAHKLNRQWIGMDINSNAWQVIQARANQPTFEQWLGSFQQATYVSRDLTEVKSLSPLQFEAWVNEYYKAHKPHPDKGVDGITTDGIPIQVKAFLVKYDTIDKFITGIRYHPAVKQPVKKAIIVSQIGFDDTSRQRQAEIKEVEQLELVLTTPEQLLQQYRG